MSNLEKKIEKVLDQCLKEMEGENLKKFSCSLKDFRLDVEFKDGRVIIDESGPLKVSDPNRAILTPAEFENLHKTHKAESEDLERDIADNLHITDPEAFEDNLMKGLLESETA